MSKLKKEEINELLKQAARAAKEERSLTSVFADFAEKTGRARGGVRNLYYALIKEGKTNAELVKRYPSLKMLKAEKNCAFTKEEEEKLYSSVREGVKRGKSVRRTIRELAGGDEKIALRYQNKYRNMMSKRGETLKERGEERFEELKKAVDKLFERIMKEQKRKEYALSDENAKLKEKLKALSGGASDSKLKSFFATKVEPIKEVKDGKVDE